MSRKSKIAENEITDGFGGVWPKCMERCGLQVVRPGKVQCWCDGLDMPAEDVVTLSEASAVHCEDVAFIVGTAEKRIREQQRAARISTGLSE